MKCVLILATLVVVSLAQMPGHNQLADLIHHEAHALVTADSSLTVDQCTTKCDALFDLIDDHDEATTDKMCAEACDCEINHHCIHDHTHHDGHTHPPHPSHPPHPDHP